MDDSIIVAIDIGTSKICALIARLEADKFRVLGAGIEPAKGIRKGAVVDIAAATQSITRAIDKAERTSGLEVSSALVSLSGAQISSLNSRGVVGISGRAITEEDVTRAMDAARAVAIPHNQEVIHIIQRNFTVDGQEGIRTPVGMHGYRLEVEAHIITAAAAVVENLRQCVQAAGVQVSQFVLTPLASAEMALTEDEREMGVVVCDIGCGTTDLAVYIAGDVWHTAVLGIGGNHITSDIAHGLRLPTEQAETIKIRHGHAAVKDIPAEEYFAIQPFGEDDHRQVRRIDLVHIIGARVEEIFTLVSQEIKRSGYDGLLPAGVVLTGGASQMPGMRSLASQVLDMPIRIAQPEELTGMVDQLNSAAFTASAGLLKWAALMNEIALKPRRRQSFQAGEGLERLKRILGKLLP